MARPFVLIPALVVAAAILALLGFVIVLSFSKMEQGVIAGFAGFGNFAVLLSDPNVPRMASNTLVFAGSRSPYPSCSGCRWRGWPNAATCRGAR